MIPVNLNITTTRGVRYWSARWCVNGKRFGKSLGRCENVTRDHARAECDKIAQGLGAGGCTVESLSVRYLAGVTDSPHGDNVRRWVGRFVGFVGGNTPVSDVRPSTADDWVESIGGEPATRAKACGLVSAMFAYAERKELVVRNPFASVKVSCARKELYVRHLSDREFVAILGACPDARWRCMFGLCRWAGLRAGEARRVKWRDLDMEKGLLHVNTPDAENPELTITTKRRARSVPLRPELRAELLACPTNDDGPCVAMGSNPSRGGMEIVRKAGVAGYGEPFQALRKMCVREWHEKHPALAVAFWCGHSAQVALRHYYAPTADAVAAVTGIGQSEQSLRIVS